MKTKTWPLLALLLAVPSITTAQDRQGGPPPRADFARMQQREGDDIALLLALRPAQRPALAAFLQSLAPPEPPQGDRPPRDGVPPGDGFAQHLQRMTEASTRHAADDTRRIAAARTFYDGLDPTQRTAFEALMRLRHGPPMMGGGREGGPPGGPMHDGPMHDGPMRGGPRADSRGGPPPSDGPPPQR